jgi:hypothetical protein
MPKRRTLRRRAAKRKTYRGGRLVFTENNVRRRTLEIEILRNLIADQASTRSSLEKKQITNEIAKFIVQMEILPFNQKWRETTLVKLNEFLATMGNDPEYRENLTAAIAYLERYN